VAYFKISDAQVGQFNRDGFLIVEGLLDADETRYVLETARGDRERVDGAMALTDASGKQSKLAMWNHPEDNIYGVIARSRRIVDTMERLFGDEVYHYHSKIMLKEPRVGGAWEWHQDYGYWYSNGCLFPDMASCLMALDPATKENGCLQVLRGSHLLGRVEHGRFGTQVGADPERVNAAMERFELVYCEMKPGTAVFFHGNTLHASAANESERPRWSLICCYNTKHNNPYKESHHPSYTPLEKLDDSAIKQFAEGNLAGVK
jgi:hypothetical protein